MTTRRTSSGTRNAGRDGGAQNDSAHRVRDDVHGTGVVRHIAITRWPTFSASSSIGARRDG